MVCGVTMLAKPPRKASRRAPSAAELGRLRTLGERLRWARTRLGLACNELARRVVAPSTGRPLARGYISNLETGRRSLPSAEYVQALAEGLGVRPGWLIDGALPWEQSGPKPALDRVLRERPRRWLPQVVGAAYGFRDDLPEWQWPRVLDIMQAALRPIVTTYGRERTR